MAEDYLPEESKKKIRLYMAASWLFNNGKSYPQVIEILQTYETDLDLDRSIADKAMREDWDKLSEEAREMFLKGYPRDEIIVSLSQKEPDPQIVIWLCDHWYNKRLEYMELLNEGPDNQFYGIKWIVISSLALFVTFSIGASTVSKIIWIAALVGALIQWAAGIMQTRTARKFEKLFNGMPE